MTISREQVDLHVAAARLAAAFRDLFPGSRETKLRFMVPEPLLPAIQAAMLPESKGWRAISSPRSDSAHVFLTQSHRGLAEVRTALRTCRRMKCRTELSGQIITVFKALLSEVLKTQWATSFDEDCRGLQLHEGEWYLACDATIISQNVHIVEEMKEVARIWHSSTKTEKEEIAAAESKQTAPGTYPRADPVGLYDEFVSGGKKSSEAQRMVEERLNKKYADRSLYYMSNRRKRRLQNGKGEAA